jgi:transcriptional regulator with XRE-family HTH domain
MSEDYKSLMDEIEKRRKEKGLSLNRFAVMELGVSASAYKRWVSGEIEPLHSSQYLLSSYLENDIDSHQSKQKKP